MNVSGEDTSLRCETPFQEVLLGFLFYPSPFGMHWYYKDSPTSGNWCGQSIQIGSDSKVAVPPFARLQQDAEADDPVDYPRVRIQQECPDANTLQQWFESYALFVVDCETITFPISAGTVIRCMSTQRRSDNVSE